MELSTGLVPAASNSQRLADVVTFLEQKRFSAFEDEILGSDPVSTRSGLVLAPGQALSVSTVFACRRVIAEDMASMSIDIVRVTYDNGRKRTVRLPDHYLSPLLNPISGAPNDWMTIFDLVEHWVGIACTSRGGYCWIVRDAKGRVLELLPLLPGSVAVHQDADWRPVYQVSGYGKTFEAEPWSLLKLNGPMADNALSGMPISTVAREAIALAAAVEGAAARFHRNDLRPSGVLAIKNAKLTEERVARIKADWKSQYGPGGEGGIALLTDEFDFKTINSTSVDSQTIENRRMQVEEICRFFRVFPVAIGHQAGQGYGTVESFLEAHYTHTLRPWEKRIELALNRHLLTADELSQGIRIRLTADRRGTFQDRWNGYDKATQVGMTPNEAREMEGMDPIDDPAMDRVQLRSNNTGLQQSLAPRGDAQAAPRKPMASAHDEQDDQDEAAAKSYGFAAPAETFGFGAWRQP